MTTPSDPLALLRSKSYLALLVLAAIIGVGGAMLELVLVPGLLAAGVGSLVFIGLDAWTGLGTFSLAIPGLPHVGSPTGVEFLWAVAIGVMAAPLGSGIRWLGLFLRPHVERRMLLVTPVAGLTVATAAAMVHHPLDGMPAPAWRDCLVLAPAEPSAVRTRPASITPLLLTGRNHHAVGMGGIPEFSGAMIRRGPQVRHGTRQGLRRRIHFRYKGGQVRSLLSYLGIKIPPANLQEHHLQEARKFADRLASRLLVSAGEPR